MTAARDRISAPCWDGRHRRCTGVLVVPDETRAGRRAKTDRLVGCRCPECDHPPVDPTRHLHENAQGPS